MSKLIKIIVGLAFVSVGLAAPAQADANQDQRFYRLLTDPDQDHPLVILNFALVRSQGIAACQRVDAGETPYHALKDMQYPNGPYTFDEANDISSTAETIYCPWHQVSLSAPDWATTPDPVSWQPVYPPLAWYPTPPPPPRPPLEYLNP